MSALNCVSGDFKAKGEMAEKGSDDGKIDPVATSGVAGKIWSFIILLGTMPGLDCGFY